MAANHRLGQLTVGLKSALGYFPQTSHHLLLTHFLIHKAEVVQSSHLSWGFLDRHPRADPWTEPPCLERQLPSFPCFHLYIGFITLCARLCLAHGTRCHLLRAR